MDEWGIDHEYEDAFRKSRKAPPQTIDAIRRSMGVSPGRNSSQNGPRVLRQGDQPTLGPGQLFLEDGTSLAIEEELPADVPAGYHKFQPADRQVPIPLIVCPAVCPLPPERMWCWAVQLYSARSETSWGIGDLGDLRRIARWSKTLGASLLMINPLHAAAPVIPQQASPYSPTSRSFRNSIYIRVPDVPGADSAEIGLAQLAREAQTLNEMRLIDRDQVFLLKRRALDQIFERFAGDKRFDRYTESVGASLQTFATFCALSEQFGGDFHHWPEAYRHPQNAEVAEFRNAHQDRVRFFAWLQWVIDLQLEAAARELPIMQDLAVGFDPGGADAWMWQDLLATDMSVGAPPDLHNPWGQYWGLPPFVPHKLEQAGFEPFVHTIRAALAHAGGLRIDHAMGLFRLFWIPKGSGPHQGTFVNYPAKALLDIVALESQRACAFVVAEDLGTVADNMRQALMRHQMLSYRLVWLEDEPPADYPQRSMAAITTHDLFSIAGFWNGSDFRNQESIGLKPAQEANEEVRSRIAKLTGLSVDSPLEEVVLTMHRLLASARSMLVVATLEDALLVEERPNMPGTTDQWPNWRIALPATLEKLEQLPLPRKIAEILCRRAAFQPVQPGR
jgi:4-alpha-glucanotransferase